MSARAAYQAGYTAGHEDGYTGQDRRFTFSSYDFSLGYRAGYDAGHASAIYARTHRCVVCHEPTVTGDLCTRCQDRRALTSAWGGRWCGECLYYTNHSTSQHQAAEAEGRQEL